VPVESIGQDPAEQDADRSAACGDETVDAHRLRPLHRLGEQGDDERERDGRDDGAAEALQGSCADKDGLGGREPAGERRQGEERDPDQEQPPVTEEIAQPAGEKEESAEGQKVRICDPRERALGEAEILADRGQRDAHDRHVEDDHQRAEADDDQREPAVSVCHLFGHARSSLVAFTEESEPTPRSRHGSDAQRSPCDVEKSPPAPTYLRERSRRKEHKP
jgi:hypothetical protein